MKLESTNRIIQASRQLAVEATSSKYHRAAIDGYVDMLCDASKRDTNLASQDERGLTPTLLAAQNGHLDALRILVGRGGDPEKSALDGSTALHLAAARNHLNCVSFLVNFGVNMWALDNELHTAKDVAAIEQRKEILDYLDKIMAKQSALNTKNVQKLKEKAKIAAEKRLKQVRKAQLKAIKQVEKDERYLAKLSHNRRLLRNAHSISDIKLVGRNEAAINYSPCDSGRSSSIDQSSINQRFDTSPITGNFNASNQLRFHYANDLLGKNRAKLNFRPSNKPLSVSYNQQSDESAYSSSSVSSMSGYMSSCTSTSAKTPTGIDRRRPKYSDLVAIGQELSFKQQQIDSNDRQAKPKKQHKNEQQSLKSNSTIVTRLRGISGVSRKVQLKRLLLISTSNLSSSASVSSSSTSAIDVTNSSELAPTISESSHSASQSNLSNHQQQTLKLDTNSGKLCNVQPAIKLKLNADSHSPRFSNSTDQTIKWPPAPNIGLGRAVSEPDFGAALQRHDDGDDDTSTDDDDDDEQEVVMDKVNNNKGENNNPKQKPEARYQGEEKTGVESEVLRRIGQTSRNESQHDLLTQCLSQLKLRHEAITKQRLDPASNNHESLIRPMEANGKRPKNQANMIGNSDELLRHQLNAGEFPLRPSIIRQQQQQHNQLLNISQRIQNLQPVDQANTKVTPNGYFPYGQPGKETTIQCVDSIGSAGSLARRNSSSSCKLTSDSSPSLVSYSSSSSSTEVTKMKTNGSNTSKTETYNKGANLGSQQVTDSTFSSKPEITLASSTCNDETIETFLLSNGLIDLKQVFANEKIDLEALMLLTEEDLKSLNILLGPRRKLLKAIENRRMQLPDKSNRSTTITQLGQQLDTRRTNVGAMYVMVDTPL